MSNCPCRILGQCTNSCARFGQLPHRKIGRLGSREPIARYVFRHRTRDIRANLTYI